MNYKGDEQPSPEEIAFMERQVLESDGKIKELLKEGRFLFPGLPDNPTYGDMLEWEATVMTEKWQQMLEFCERTANDVDDLGRLIDDPKERKEWLKKADKLRKTANEMRQKSHSIRKGAQAALEELDELK